MRQIRVLLVDDCAEFRSAAAGFLASDPRVQIVGHAADGLEGIKRTQELSPHLVLMDVSMPVMDGLEATRRIKGWLTSPRVVIVSLHDGAEYQRSAREARADGFICKADFTEAMPAHLDACSAWMAKASGIQGDLFHGGLE